MACIACEQEGGARWEMISRDELLLLFLSGIAGPWSGSGHSLVVEVVEVVTVVQCEV